MPETNPDTELYWLIGIVAFIFLIAILFGLAQFLMIFHMNYVTSIMRSGVPMAKNASTGYAADADYGCR